MGFGQRSRCEPVHRHEPMLRGPQLKDGPHGIPLHLTRRDLLRYERGTGVDGR
jgi:hypothetical protein